MDRLRRGATVVLGRTGIDLCPVRVVLAFMVQRKAGPGLFFQNKDVTRATFIDEVRKSLSKAGMASHHICGHSFRIGVATALFGEVLWTLRSRCSGGGGAGSTKGTLEGTAICRHLWQGNWSGDQEQVAVKDKTCSYSHVCDA